MMAVFTAFALLPFFLCFSHTLDDASVSSSARVLLLRLPLCVVLLPSLVEAHTVLQFGEPRTAWPRSQLTATLTNLST